MKFTDFNPLSDLCFGEYDRGIPITGQDGKPIQFQIPRVYAPFGLSGFPNKFGPVKYNIDASLRGWNQDGSYVKKFYDFLRDIEIAVIDYVRKNNILPNADESFNSNLKMSEKYDPKFRIKVDKNTVFFDANNNNITPDELSDGIFRGHSFTALVELKSVYFFNKQMGLTWMVVQAKMYEPAQRREETDEKLNGFKFLV
jgi:hypothetical protein